MIMMTQEIKWDPTTLRSFSGSLSTCGYWKIVKRPQTDGGDSGRSEFCLERKVKVYGRDRADWEWIPYPVNGVDRFPTMHAAKQALNNH